MTVTRLDKDPGQLTLTLTAEFAAPPDRVWQVWADPRLLERWWGPPEWPSTFVEHDLRVGGWAKYYMTGPDGGRAHGWWRFTAVDPPKGLSFEDGFADAEGAPVPGEPTVAEVSIEAGGPGTRMTILSRFASLEQLEELRAMGMEEGIRQSVGQIDAVLADQG
jgi:uncharacterized protein YndB with AHSA1/START domain